MHSFVTQGFVYSLLLSLSSLGSSQTRENSQAKDNLSITVRVYNYAGAGDYVMKTAQKEAGRILNHAGVAALWLDCPLTAQGLAQDPSCNQHHGPKVLSLRILPRKMTRRIPVPKQAFGLALLLPGEGFSKTANVLFHRVEAFARRTTVVSTTALLGHIMAHELGHLLLGANSHATEGMMTDHWYGATLKQAALGHILFSPQETQKIRENVAARLESQRPRDGAKGYLRFRPKEAKNLRANVAARTRAGQEQQVR